MKKIFLLAVAVVSIASVNTFAQHAAEQKTNSIPKQKAEKMKYTCPMHPEVTSDKPGKCSKCGMDLVKAEKEKMKYTCPMHPEVTSDKPGKCSKCGMELKEKKENHSEHQHSSPDKK
jgi:uncharacterized paraquat-inducible protein A